MSLTEYIANNIKVLHKVNNIPTSTSKIGIHLVKNGGVYIVAKDMNNPALKIVHKIYESSDYYLKGDVDTMLAAQKQLLDDADTLIRNQFNAADDLLQDQITTLQQTTATHTTEIQNIKDEYVANKGYYNSLSALQTAYPTPNAGDIAYVANAASTTGYYIYNVVGGAWTATTVEAPPVAVPLNDYALSGGSEKTLKAVDDEIVQLKDLNHNNSKKLFRQVTSASNIIDNVLISKVYPKKNDIRVELNSGYKYLIKQFDIEDNLLEQSQTWIKESDDFTLNRLVSYIEIHLTRNDLNGITNSEIINIQLYYYSDVEMPQTPSYTYFAAPHFYQVYASFSKAITVIGNEGYEYGLRQYQNVLLLEATDTWLSGTNFFILNSDTDKFEIVCRNITNEIISLENIKVYEYPITTIEEELKNFNVNLKEERHFKGITRILGKYFDNNDYRFHDDPDFEVIKDTVFGVDEIEYTAIRSNSRGVTFTDQNNSLVGKYNVGLNNNIKNGEKVRVKVPARAKNVMITYIAESALETYGYPKFEIIHHAHTEKKINIFREMEMKRITIAISANSDNAPSSLYFPTIIKPKHVENPFGKYYMFFSTDHVYDGTISGIYLAYSDDMKIWRTYGRVVSLQGQITSLSGECETPSVVWDDKKQIYKMFWHSSSVHTSRNYVQSTLISESTDLINWTFLKECFDTPMDLYDGDGHNGYMTVYKQPNSSLFTAVHLMGGTDYSFFTNSYSYDLENWFMDRNISLGQHQYDDKFTYENLCDMFFKDGRNFLITLYGTPSSGINPTNYEVAIIEVADDLRTQIGKPYIIATMESERNESSVIRSISTFTDDDEQVYIIYNYGLNSNVGNKIAIGKLINI